MADDVRRYSFATAPSANTRMWDQQAPATWDEFVEWLDVEHPASRKDCGGYVMGQLGGTAPKRRRAKDNVASRSAAALDADTALVDFVLDVRMNLAGVALVVHPTWSHTPEHPRYRVVVPLSRDVTGDEYRLIVQALMQHLGVEQFDPGSAQPERLMYRPSTQDRAAYEHEVVDGEPLDVEVWLAKATDMGLDVPEMAETEPEAAPGGVPTGTVPEARVREAVAWTLGKLDALHPLAEGERLDWPGETDGVGWDRGAFLAAGRLKGAADASGGSYSREQAQADYEAHAPASEGNYDRDHHWRRAVPYWYDGERPADDFTAVPKGSRAGSCSVG